MFPDFHLTVLKSAKQRFLQTQETYQAMGRKKMKIQKRIVHIEAVLKNFW
jgi:hypothetical protein